MESSSAALPVKGRIGKWDNLKGFLMIMVVMGHSSNQYAKWSLMMKGTSLFIYSFHMPLFIFLAGLFTKKWDGNRPFDWSKPLYFCLLGIILKISITLVKLAFHEETILMHLGDKSTPWYKFAQAAVTDTGIPWYMFAMAAFMVLTWVFRKADPWILLPVWIVAACLAGYVIWINAVFNLSRIIVFFPFFYLGYLLDQKQVKKFTDKIWVRIASPFIIAVTLWVSFSHTGSLYPYIRLFTSRNPYFTINVAGCGFADRFLFYLITSLIGIAFMSLTPSPSIPLLHKTGSRTLQIYLWHRPFMFILYYSGVTSYETISGHFVHWEIWVLVFAVLLTFLLTPAVFGRPLDWLRKKTEAFTVSIQGKVRQ